jgi:hypothetical protein
MFKTPGKLPIILENFIEYTWARCPHVTGVDTRISTDYAQKSPWTLPSTVT